MFERYDVWPAVLVLVAFVALLLGRRTLGLAALGVGAAAKIYPLALLPLALLSRRGRAHVPRDLAVFAAAALVFLLPFMLVGPRGIGHVGKVLVERPLQVESLGASVLLAAHRLGVYEPTIDLSFAQSWDLAGPAADVTAAVSSLLGAVALVAVWYLFARGPRGPRRALAGARGGRGRRGDLRQGLLARSTWCGSRRRCRSRSDESGRSRCRQPSQRSFSPPYVYQWGYPDLLDAGHTSWVMVARNAVMVAVFCSLLLELGGAIGDGGLWPGICLMCES